ncbi:non-specific serine/threonine protein kinase [Plasmodiophora brassicae]|uniref:Protein kinase domain-containing protein n=1 Tax=Plasmodiophora brassicae TaxID=37360 RepID=A0A0G4IZS8_PLABS|nr:hypothetical protein PBRA_008180 [Plasmodiophora brassicae]
MSHRNRADLEGVETSPDGRYIRFDEKLGSGAYKSVWLAYDTDLGIEVAWNTVELKRLPEREKVRLKSETDILKNLNHNCIINFYNSWENPDAEQVIFTTEIVTSGTLKQYVSRFKPVKLKVIKKWCRQILQGLCYLHSKTPPIIHRDLKCDNIFINGSTGDIRIGDLGLSTMRNATHVASVLGTPEFMAPELYDEWYTEKVDVYAFGMCVLEMISNEYPYAECTNTAQIFKKVSAGIRPESLNRVTDWQTREFIELCLAKSNFRLAADDLLRHPFLDPRFQDYRERAAINYEPITSTSPTTPLVPVMELAAVADHSESSQYRAAYDDDSESQREAAVSSLEVTLESTVDNIARIVLRLDLGSRRKEIKFPFDLESDTAESVAIEMVKELDLQESASGKLAEGIDSAIRDEKKKWKAAARSLAPPTSVNAVGVNTDVDQPAMVRDTMSLLSTPNGTGARLSPTPAPSLQRALSFDVVSDPFTGTQAPPSGQPVADLPPRKEPVSSSVPPSHIYVTPSGPPVLPYSSGMPALAGSYTAQAPTGAVPPQYGTYPVGHGTTSGAGGTGTLPVYSAAVSAASHAPTPSVTPFGSAMSSLSSSASVAGSSSSPVTVPPSSVGLSVPGGAAAFGVQSSLAVPATLTAPPSQLSISPTQSMHEPDHHLPVPVVADSRPRPVMTPVGSTASIPSPSVSVSSSGHGQSEFPSASPFVPTVTQGPAPQQQNLAGLATGPAVHAPASTLQVPAQHPTTTAASTPSVQATPASGPARRQISEEPEASGPNGLEGHATGDRLAPASSNQLYAPGPAQPSSTSSVESLSSRTATPSSKSPDSSIDMSTFLTGFDISVLTPAQLATLRSSRSQLDENIRALKAQYATMYREAVNKYKVEVYENLTSWGINVPPLNLKTSSQPRGGHRPNARSGSSISNAPGPSGVPPPGLSRRTRDVISIAQQGGSQPDLQALESLISSSNSTHTAPSRLIRAPASASAAPTTTTASSADNPDNIYNRLIQPFAPNPDPPSSSPNPAGNAPTNAAQQYWPSDVVDSDAIMWATTDTT